MPEDLQLFIVDFIGVVKAVWPTASIWAHRASTLNASMVSLVRFDCVNVHGASVCSRGVCFRCSCFSFNCCAVFHTVTLDTFYIGE